VGTKAIVIIAAAALFSFAMGVWGQITFGTPAGGAALGGMESAASR
jgi:hypothetical protein